MYMFLPLYGEVKISVIMG